MPYSIISCAGWETATGYVAGGPCIKARLIIVLLFFLVAILRKWGGEEIGISFSFLFGILGALVPYFIIVTIFGSFKIGLIIGLLGAVVGGYGGGMIFESDDEGGGY